MRPDAQLAMRNALDHGPGHCPADLFDGDRDRIFLGLKARANSIAHARHHALEETFPRTRALIGAPAFHRAAERHLCGNAVRARRLAVIGKGFADLLDGRARDLAALEWAWLRTHGAPDAPPLDLPALAGFDAESLVALWVARHPAVVAVALAHPLRFDDVDLAPGTALVTRPREQVMVQPAGKPAHALLAGLSRPHSMADLLQSDPDALTELVGAGALQLIREPNA